MTQILKTPPATPGLRVVLIGAGAYPSAQGQVPGLPLLNPLFSVKPSVLGFTQKLLTDWRPSLAAPLISVDILLNDAASPAGCSWPGFGTPDEIPPGSPLAAPTLPNIDAAVAAALAGATSNDTLLIIVCGHGFAREGRFFVPSDFGSKPLAPWMGAVDLDALALGLRQCAPRQQWLFWDCCSDIPQGILDTLSSVGDPIVAPSASALAGAAGQYGDLHRFLIASSPFGAQAYGIADAPSRFMEMLIEAIDGVGATRKQNGQWWVDDHGLVDALQSYAKRHPELVNPKFYSYVMPVTSDAPARMRLRQLAAAPLSRMITRSTPRASLRDADLVIARQGAAPEEKPVYDNDPPREQAVFSIAVPALYHYAVSADFKDGVGVRTLSDVFADLPCADDAEFIL